MSADIVAERGMTRLASISSLDPPRPVDFNGPVDRPYVPLPDSALDRPLFETFAAVAARAPDAIALEDGEAELRYGDLLEQASRLGSAIARVVAPGEPVGIALPNGVRYPVAMLAALAAGRPYVPLDLTFPAERNALIVQQSGMKAVVVDDDTKAAMRSIEGAPPPLDYAIGIADRGSAVLSPSPDDVARIIYTSGSTGRPKGVHLSQRSLCHKSLRRTNQQHLSSDDRTILLSTPAVNASERAIFGTLLTGARLVIVDLRRKGLQEAARVMARRGITIYASAPFVFRRLMELCRDPATVARVREVKIGTDRSFASDVALFRERFPKTCLFACSYGANETSTTCAWFVPRDRTLDRPLLPVGYVMPDYEIRVVDEAGQPVPRGDVGEIVVAGRYIAEGYWRDEALTRRAFTVDPRDPKRRIYRTGDLGVMGADGLMELVGRKDRQIKIRGMRVEPTEVEATLRGHSAIRDAAIIPRQVRDGIEIVAYATPHPNQPAPTQAELSAWLSVRLPHAMRPRRLYLVPALPLLGNFKPDILKLQEFDRQRAATEADAMAARMEAPSGLSVHDAVRSRWERVLGPSSFSADLSWEEAGGDSLKALELVFALEQMLLRPVAMGLVGSTTRPSELIAALQGMRDGSSGTIDRSSEEARLFFLPGYSGLVFHEAVFVQALGRQMKIDVLDYPPIVPTRMRPVGFDDIVTHVVRAIHVRRIPGEPFGLLGFSFGASVAFAVAGRLKAEGIDPGFVGLVDGAAPGRGPVAEDIAPPEDAVERSRFWPRPLRRLITAVMLPRYAFERLITESVEHETFVRLAWLWRALVLLRLRSAQALFRVLTMRLLRPRARIGHRFEYYPGPVSVYRGLENKAWLDLPDDLGWSDWCEGVTVSAIPGDHLGMLAPGNLELLTRAIITQCGRSVAPAEPETAP
jgi:amino acid adenylation domain-containing protein